MTVWSLISNQRERSGEKRRVRTGGIAIRWQSGYDDIRCGIPNMHATLLHADELSSGYVTVLSKSSLYPNTSLGNSVVPQDKVVISRCLRVCVAACPAMEGQSPSRSMLPALG